MFCSGGINKDDPFNKKDNKENGMMLFFRNYVGGALNKNWVKILILVVYAGYVAVSGWGVSQIREGLERKRLARYDSYSTGYYSLEDGQYREYPYRISVSFRRNGELFTVHDLGLKTRFFSLAMYR